MSTVPHLQQVQSACIVLAVQQQLQGYARGRHLLNDLCASQGHGANAAPHQQGYASIDARAKAASISITRGYSINTTSKLR